MGYRLNCLDVPVFIAASKPLLTEFGIHDRLESFALFVLSKLTKIYTLHILVPVSIFPNLLLLQERKVRPLNWLRKRD